MKSEEEVNIEKCGCGGTFYCIVKIITAVPLKHYCRITKKNLMKKEFMIMGVDRENSFEKAYCEKCGKSPFINNQ